MLNGSVTVSKEGYIKIKIQFEETNGLYLIEGTEKNTTSHLCKLALPWHT